MFLTHRGVPSGAKNGRHFEAASYGIPVPIIPAQRADPTATVVAYVAAFIASASEVSILMVNSIVVASWSSLPARVSAELSVGQ